MKKNLQSLASILLIIWMISQNAFAQIGLQEIKIGVISDVHLFDTTLLIKDGPAINTYLAYDRKLLKESYAITRSLVDSLKAQSFDILLVSGDLSKDGENISLQTLAAFFQEMESNGTHVLVTPGNHDINNPHAVAFDSATMIPVQGTSPAQFKSIFGNYGFSQALLSDTASLSYIIEPIQGFQVISIDVCRYDSNYAIGSPETGGGYKPQVLQWVKDRLQEAKTNHKVVIAMQHHNLLEHYLGQKAMFSDYVIDDWDTISNQLADLGLKAMFTGHYHAQDIILKTTAAGNTIYDIETGSTVTYPCPYRVMKITTDTNLIINGKRVEAINYNTGGLTFQNYARTYIENGLPILVNYILTSPPYSLDSVTAAMVTPAVTETFIAHYEGNEGSPSAQTNTVIQMLKQHPSYYSIGYALEGIWNDAAPDDWTVSIDLNNYKTSVGLEKPIQLNNILLFPNPSLGVFNLLFNDIHQDIFVEVFDMSGKRILTENTKEAQHLQIDLSNYPAGQYLLKLSAKDFNLSRKIVVE